MKITKSILLSLTIMVFVFAANAETSVNKKAEGDKTEVYYFHNTRRCATCNAIETETKKVLQEKQYADAIENGELEFKEFNAEDSANKKLVKKMGITGSSLIIVKGDKKIDLTSKGFMYALKQPEKLQDAVRKALNDLK